MDNDLACGRCGAIGEQQKPLACSRCGAPMQVPFTFRALNVHCQHCRTVNGFEPGMRMRMGEICIHPLCEEAIHVLKNHERAQIAFWRRYHFYKMMEMKGAWVNAGFPRDLV